LKRDYKNQIDKLLSASELLQEKLSAESNEHGRIQANIAMQVQELTRKLTKARELLFAVHPFCKAWACFDLADDIEEFLNGGKKKEVKNKRPPTNT
jgi:hypothetical protein